MNVGSLATVATISPRNLTIVCIDNACHGETGGKWSTAPTSDSWPGVLASNRQFAWSARSSWDRPPNSCARPGAPIHSSAGHRRSADDLHAESRSRGLPASFPDSLPAGEFGEGDSGSCFLALALRNPGLLPTNLRHWLRLATSERRSLPCARQRPRSWLWAGSWWEQFNCTPSLLCSLSYHRALVSPSSS